MREKEYLRAPEYIKAWSRENPEIAETFQILDDAGVRAALYSGSVADLGMRRMMAHSISWLPSPALNCFSDLSPGKPLGYHSPNDIDMLVHGDDFWAAADILEADVVHESREVDTIDDYHLDYDLYVARKKIGSKILEICHPNSSMLVQNNSSKVEYNWHVSDLAANNFFKFKTRQGIVQIAHPTETTAIYSILQRSDEDINKAAFCLASIPSRYPDRTEDYYSRRIEEMSLCKDRIVPFGHRVIRRYYEIALERERKSFFGNVKRFARRTQGQVVDYSGDQIYKLNIDLESDSVEIVAHKIQSKIE